MATMAAAILPGRRMSHGRLLLGEREIGCSTCLPLSGLRAPGSSRAAPDHRTRRALLHLSYSCAPQATHAAVVTLAPGADISGFKFRSAARFAPSSSMSWQTGRSRRSWMEVLEQRLLSKVEWPGRA